MLSIFVIACANATLAHADCEDIYTDYSILLEQACGKPREVQIGVYKDKILRWEGEKSAILTLYNQREKTLESELTRRLRGTNSLAKMEILASFREVFGEGRFEVVLDADKEPILTARKQLAVPLFLPPSKEYLSSGDSFPFKWEVENLGAELVLSIVDRKVKVKRKTAFEWPSEIEYRIAERGDWFVNRGKNKIVACSGASDFLAISQSKGSLEDRITEFLRHIIIRTDPIFRCGERGDEICPGIAYYADSIKSAVAAKHGLSKSKFFSLQSGYVTVSKFENSVLCASPTDVAKEEQRSFGKELLLRAIQEQSAKPPIQDDLLDHIQAK